MSTVNVLRVRFLNISFLVLIFFLHLFFLKADPDINISTSRGPFTDEGLYTMQIRNYLNFGELNMEEGDALLKAPLFNLIQYLPLKFFGIHLSVARMVVVMFSLIVIGMLAATNSFSVVCVFFIPITLAQYHVFHFTHFALAEMICISFVLLAIWAYYKNWSSVLLKKKSGYIFLSVFFISCAWFTKIQFLYLLPMVPLWVAGEYIFLQPKQVLRQGGMLFLAASFFSLTFLLAYFIFWYLPNQSFYNYMMTQQSGMIDLSLKSFKHVVYNLLITLLNRRLALFTLFFYAMFYISTYMLKKQDTFFRLMFLLLATWLLLEAHKLTMEYLPTRYLVSIYVAMGMMISLVLKTLFFSEVNESLGKMLKVGAGVLLIYNLTWLFLSLSNRSFKIQEINTYLKENVPEGEFVIGSWAPSLTWESRVRSFAVIDQFLNYKDPLRVYNPEVIVSETDEEDSLQAYEKQQIDLKGTADSVRVWTIGGYEVGVYWIR